MNKFKKFLAIGLCAMVLPCAGLISGCTTEDPVSILSIEKTATDGLVDTYTIYYTDGTSTTFTITNGKDGIDGEKGEQGEDLTIVDVYNKYCTENGYITYEDFLKKYLTLNLGGNSAVINRCLNSVMKVYAEFYETVASFGQTVKRTNMNIGSAIIYSMDQDYSYIVTNYHVMYNGNANLDNGSYVARKIYGYLYGSEGYPVDTETTNSNGYAVYDYGDYAIEMEYVGGSITNDLAVLKVSTSALKAINPNAQAVKVASEYHVGETAIAIGNPEAEGISVTEGVVSIDSEYINLQIDSSIRSYRTLRIDTSIYSGNSGGGLFNANGELIGITNAGDGTDQSINYALPISVVKAFADNVIYYHEQSGGVVSAQKIVLGIEVNVSNSKYVYDSSLGYGKIVEDDVLSKITEESIANILGLKVDDIINSIYVNNEEYVIDRTFNIGDTLLNIRANDKIKIKYTRDSVESVTNEYEVQLSDLAAID